MNLLILSAGTRNKVVQYFKKECGEKDKIIATDCSNLAPAVYDADTAPFTVVKYDPAYTYYGTSSEYSALKAILAPKDYNIRYELNGGTFETNAPTTHTWSHRTEISQCGCYGECHSSCLWGGGNNGDLQCGPRAGDLRSAGFFVRHGCFGLRRQYIHRCGGGETFAARL